MGDLSDAELLAAFRAGDSRAFEALVRRYQRPVLAIARRFARDEDDAEDLAQRAFINASERAAGSPRAAHRRRPAVRGDRADPGDHGGQRQGQLPSRGAEAETARSGLTKSDQF